MKTLLITAFFLFVPAIAASIEAASNTGQPVRIENHYITKQQAANIAKAHVPGRVLSVTRHENVYRVKILRNNGSVVIVTINAQTGKAE